MPKFFRSAKQIKTNTKKKIKMISISTKILNVTLITLLFVFSFAYLVQMNSLSTKGYQIKELESKISDLQQDSKDLELQVFELKSMDNIKSKVSQLNMVKVDKVEYLSPTPVALAK